MQQGTPEMRVGHWIRHARTEAKRSQAEVALACAVSRQLVGRWERGDEDSTPDINQFRRLANYLDAPWLWEVAASSTGCYEQLDLDTHIPLSALTLVR